MRYGKLRVEQLNINGQIVLDRDISLSRNELFEIISTYFDVEKQDHNCFICNYNDNKIAIYAKNITYLGSPHPLFKKRIQLGEYLLDAYDYFSNKNIPLLIFGVYTYNDNLIFVDFAIDNYVLNKSNNSSAHVLMSDLQQAYDKGLYSKIDIKSNKITAFTSDNINKFLEKKLYKEEDVPVEVFNELDEFFDSLKTEWDGIECYKEMIDDDFNNKYQAEWPGFYLEYKLSHYIENKDSKHLIEYKQNKKKLDVDLDLFFPGIPAYGDLKCHSNEVVSIPGNDYKTVMKIIENFSIYYVVCEHKTIKDKQLEYKTTKFWNTVQDKKDLMSYSNRMKGHVSLINYMVLEINKYNARYLSNFQDGFVNSNGVERNKKIMISNKELSNFVIYGKVNIKM